jgi:hypothetical protein
MTRKEIQKQENMLVEKAWKVAKQVWFSQSIDVDESKRLNSCQAYWYKTGGYIFLRSYNTVVAFIDNNGNMYDVLRLVYGYTTTSAKHISKFRSMFRHGSEHTWR